MERFVQRLRKILNFQEENNVYLTVPTKDSFHCYSKKNEVMSILMQSITFMDLYKQINYKKVTSTLKEEDLLIIPIIDSIINMEHVEFALKNYPYFSDYLISASVDFYNASVLEKIAQIKALKEEEKQFLLEVVPPFQEDLDFYDKKIDIEILYLYYKNIEVFYEIRNFPFMKESIIDQIVGFLKNLYHYDHEDYINIVLSLALIDYKYSTNLLKEEKYPDISNGRKKTIYRINLFEESEIGDIVNYSIFDDYYLFELLDTYIYTRSKHKKEIEYKVEYNNIEIEKNKELVKKYEERIKKYGK